MVTGLGAKVNFQDKPTTQETRTHARGGFFHHTAWDKMTPHATHLCGHCSAGNPPSRNQGNRRWLGLCTAVERTSPEEKIATTVITMPPAWGRSSCNCAKCSLFITLHWSCVLDYASQKNFRAMSFLSSPRCDFLSPPGEYIESFCKGPTSLTGPIS